MDTNSLKEYRQVIENVLADYAKIPYSYADIQSKLVIDRQGNDYLLMSVGWQKPKRIHGVTIHVEIIGDKVWIQQDGTEEGIAEELVKAGIPRDKIVLGFRPPDLRQYTDYAVG